MDKTESAMTVCGRPHKGDTKRNCTQQTACVAAGPQDFVIFIYCIVESIIFKIGSRHIVPQQNLPNTVLDEFDHTWAATQQDVVVFPTPPFPPTNIH